MQKLGILLLLVFTLSKLSAQIVDLGECISNGLSKNGFVSLQQQIGDARIVIIGEQEHGVGTDYESFAFWVQHLHEEMGFNVILQEHCFFHFGQVNSELENGQSAQEYRSGMYWPQGKAIENNLLFNYIDFTQTTTSPLRMEGFDCRIFQRKECYSYLDTLLHTPDYQKIINKKQDYLSVLKRVLELEYKDTISDEQDKKHFFENTDKLIITLSKTDKIRKAQLFKNLKAFAKNAWGNRKYPMGNPDRFYIREKQMAKNIIWFADSIYPNEKIIIRMHNGHAAKNYHILKGSLDQKQMKTTPNAGSLLHNRYGEQCIHIASTYYSGTYCKWDYKEKPIPQVNSNSFEYQMHRQGLKYAFVSLQKQKEIPFQMFFNDFNLWINKDVFEARFGMLYDGVIFIDQVFKPNPLNDK